MNDTCSFSVVDAGGATLQEVAAFFIVRLFDCLFLFRLWPLISNVTLWIGLQWHSLDTAGRVTTVNGMTTFTCKVVSRLVTVPRSDDTQLVGSLRLRCKRHSHHFSCSLFLQLAHPVDSIGRFLSGAWSQKEKNRSKRYNFTKFSSCHTWHRNGHTEQRRWTATNGPPIFHFHP